MAQYIINRYGALHSIPDDWPLPVGSRLATSDEIAAWWQAQGITAEADNAASQHEQPDSFDARPNRRPRRG